ncbi:ABC transporter ATP-binding protein/permease [Pseudonocardia sp. RS11V-5]|uniref:ATP-binding cassette domain-containing protein n=1 Tax=Pseudonocardia terrae TaxID=2905831 RepID=UPI001E62FE1D|nr:ABC transporter ATP-binding protein [Pseudonocardia terrae]MCE3553034.1 ABC transporter ATP-binding protein/permease [Pseudonocardia terrae]
MSGRTALSTGPTTPVALLRAGMRGTRPAWVGLLWFSVCEGVPAVVTGRLVATALDDGFLADRPGLGVALLGALLVLALCGALATRQIVPRVARIAEALRDHLVRHVVAATLRSAVAGTAPGHDGGDAAAVARLTGQVESVRLTGAALLRTARGVAVGLVAGVAGLALLSPVLLALVVPPLVAALLLFGLLLRPLARRQRRTVLAEEAIATETAGVLFGLRDVLACQAGDRAADVLHERIDEQVAATRALGRATVVRILIVALGAQVPLAALLLAGPLLVGNGVLTAGELVGATSYLLVSLGPALSSLVHVVGSMALQLFVTVRRLAEIDATTDGARTDGTAAAGSERGTVPAPRPPARPSTEPAWARRRHVPVRRLIPVPPVQAGVRARGLTFAYGPHSAPVVEDLDLDLADGEHLAVVGPSGGGKSTLTLLLAGLLPPAAGEVWLGGMPVAALHPRVRHAAITLVPQQAYLFQGSVEENLGYLTPFADPAAMHRSVRAVGAEELVEGLGGYRGTVVPATLSSGQRQLLALARAHLSRARFCILDEACCHLDPAAEQVAEQAFRERGGTLLVVAHRTGSAARADRVLVLDGARARVGTYADLAGPAPVPARVGVRTEPRTQVGANRAGERLSPLVVTHGRDGGGDRVGLVH